MNKDEELKNNIKSMLNDIKDNTTNDKLEFFIKKQPPQSVKAIYIRIISERKFS